MPYKFNVEFQKLIIKYIIEKKKIRYIDIIESNLFDNNVLEIIFCYIKKEFKQFYKIPSFDAMRRNAGGLYNIGVDENIPETKDKILETIDKIEQKEDIPEEELKEQIYDFIKMQETRRCWVDLGYDIDKGIYNAPKYISRLRAIESFRKREDIFYYTEEYNKPDYLKKTPKVKTGIASLNRWLDGGLQIGEIGLVTGKVGIGKTFFLINLGVSAFCEGCDVFYITLEIGKQELKQSIDSCISGMHWHEIKENPDIFKERIETKKKIGGELAIIHYPENTASVDIIESDILYAKEKVKENGELFNPKLLIVDYLENLKLNAPIDMKYEGLGQATAGLRRLGQEQDIAVWCAQQVIRKAFKKEPRMEDTQSSIKIPAVVDVFLGLSPDPDHGTDVMRLTCDKLRRAKNRSNEKIYVKFKYDLSQIVEFDVKEIDKKGAKNESIFG